MGEKENYFGIKSMKNNPLDTAFKQNLSRLWFLDPDITASKARTMTHTYIWHPQAKSMVERLERNLRQNEKDEIADGILEKILEWGILNGFPTYEELSGIEEYIGSSAESFIRWILSLLLDIDVTETAVCAEFLEKYSSYLSQNETDAVLDLYLKGKELNKGNENQLLLNFE